MRIRERGAALLLVAVLGACGNEPTGTQQEDVAAHRRLWQAHAIMSYRYDFDQVGFFNGCLQPVRVYVHAEHVDSATAIRTGEPMVPPQLGFCAPTITQLFDEADSAAKHGSLSAIRYDEALGYPTRIDISGPPDASGYLTATGLVPAP